MANISNETNLNDPTIISTSQSTEDVNQWIQGFYLFLVITEGISAVVGLFCNVAVVYAFIFYKKLRTSVTNYFVISLAISDILTTGFVTSFHLDASTKAHLWTHGEFMCRLYTTMYLLAVPSSIINLCAVTVDRYLVLRMPLRYNTLMTPGRAVFIICSLWIYAIIWASLPVMGWKVDFPAVEDGYCYFLSTRDYNVSMNIINFVLPMIFMAVFWSLIYAIVHRHHKRFQNIERSLSLNTNESSNSSNGEVAQINSIMSSGNPNRDKIKMRRHVRGSRYIGFIVVLFYFCWFPYVTTSLIGNLCESCDPIPFVVYDAFLALGFLNSALNPFLYPFHDKHFKEAFRDMWRKMRSRTLVKLLRLRQRDEAS
ncbi:D(1A) dopamine receptor-like [Montipora foliosa]|uniref:D(1A) dopamine receptor-like n=1 Tax=Montipora foliosa TaxID=591990 RepID=UPI0035F1829A